MPFTAHFLSPSKPETDRMSLTDLGKAVVHSILEPILCGATYYTGYAALRLLGVRRTRLAPYGLFGERNAVKEGQLVPDWSPWLHERDGKPMLKAEATCVVGLAIGIGTAIELYHFAGGN